MMPLEKIPQVLSESYHEPQAEKSFIRKHDFAR